MPTQTTAPLPRAIGIYLAAVQFLFALSWVVYAAYLPELVRRLGHAGSEQRIVPWILVADQAVFIVTDLLVGVWSDRAVRIVTRLSRAMLAMTLVSGLAFALMPASTSSGSTGAFVALTFVWAVTSSALRAPPLTLLGRYVARPSQPAMVALLALGLGLCNAIAPYVALQLKALDPLLPFAFSALALTAVTLGMGWAERALAGSRATAAPAGTPARTAPGSGQRAARLMLVTCVLAAVAFQMHVFLVSRPLLLRHVTVADLSTWLPVFWVGFNLALWPASRRARQVGAPRTLAQGAALAAVAVGAALVTRDLALLALAQAVAGAGWALVICGAFSSALGFGHTGREGRFSGALQAILAFGALSRVMVVTVVAPDPTQVLAWGGLVALGFATAAVSMTWGLKRLPGWPASA